MLLLIHTFKTNLLTRLKLPDQDVIDDNGKSIHGLDHIVDSYINMEVKLPFREKELYGSVVGLYLDKNGRMIGNLDPNPHLNTVLYRIKFEDGTTAASGGNIIAKNRWRMCNNEGYHEETLHSIIDIRFCKNAVKDGFIYNCNDKRVLKKIREELIYCVRSRVV